MRPARRLRRKIKDRWPLGPVLPYSSRMTKAFDTIAAGLAEAIAYAEGDAARKPLARDPAKEAAAVTLSTGGPLRGAMRTVRPS